MREALEIERAVAAFARSPNGGLIMVTNTFSSLHLVVRRGWIDEPAYADLVGLCQFLPGPASSQVGLSIGLMRAGYWGGLAAWTGFTLPSAIALVLFAYGADALGGLTGTGLLHGHRRGADAPSDRQSLGGYTAPGTCSTGPG
jgi:chromate transporter